MCEEDDVKKLLSLIMMLMLAGAITSAANGSTDPSSIPDPWNSTAWAENCGRHTMAPCGGDVLGDDAGAAEDYTVHLILLDLNGSSIPGIPGTDMWLEHDNLMHCGYTPINADQETNAQGYSLFSVNPGQINAGLVGDASDGINCDTDTQFLVFVMGIVINSGNPVCVSSDSPDLNGDLTVGIADFGKYPSDFNCPDSCDPCHDYNEDGSNTVADFAIFSSYYNDCECP